MSIKRPAPAPPAIAPGRLVPSLAGFGGCAAVAGVVVLAGCVHLPPDVRAEVRPALPPAPNHFRADSGSDSPASPEHVGEP